MSTLENIHLVRFDEKFNAFYERRVTVEKGGNGKIVLDPEVGIFIDGVPISGGADDPTIPPRVAALEAEQATTAGKISSLEAEQGVTSTRVSSLEAEQATTNNKISSLEAEQATTAGKISSLETGQATTTGKISSLEAEQATTNTAISSLEAEQATTNSKVSTLEVRMITAETKLAAVETNTAGLEVRTSLLENSSSTNTAAIANITPRVVSLENSNAVTTGRIDDIESSVSNLGTRIDNNGDDIASLETAVASGNSRVTALESSAVTTSHLLTEMADDLDALAAKAESNTTAIANLAGLESRVSTNEQDISLLGNRVTATEVDLVAVGISLSAAKADLLAVETGLSAVENATNSLTARVTTNEGDIASLELATSVLPNMDTRITNLENSSGGDPVVLPYYLKTSAVDFGTGFTKVDKDKLTLGSEQVSQTDITGMKSVNAKFSSFSTAKAPDSNSHVVYFDQATGDVKWSTEVLTSVTLPSYTKPAEIAMGTGQNITLNGEAVLSSNSLSFGEPAGPSSISYGADGITYTSTTDPASNVSVTPVKMYKSEKMVEGSSSSTPLVFNKGKKVVVYDNTLGAEGFGNMNLPSYLNENNVTMGSAVLDTPTLTGLVGLNAKYSEFANVATPGANDNDVIFNTATQKYKYTKRVDPSSILPAYLKQTTIEMNPGVQNSTLIGQSSYGFTTSPSQYSHNELTISDSGNTTSFSCNKDGFVLSNTGVVTTDNPALITMRRSQLAALQRFLNAADGSAGANSKMVTYDKILKTYTLANLPVSYTYLKNNSVEFDSMVLTSNRLYSTNGAEISGVKDTAFSTSMSKQDNSGFLAFSTTNPLDGIRYGRGGISSLSSSIPTFDLTNIKLAALSSVVDYSAITASAKYFSIANRATNGTITHTYEKVPTAFSAVKDTMFDFSGIGTVSSVVDGSLPPVINRNGLYFPLTNGSTTINSTYLCQKELVFDGLPLVSGTRYKTKVSDTGTEVASYNGTTNALIGETKYGYDRIQMSGGSYMNRDEFHDLSVFGRGGLVIKPSVSGTGSYVNTISSGASHLVSYGTSPVKTFHQMMIPRVARINVTPSTYPGPWTSTINTIYNVLRIRNILDVPGDEAIITFNTSFSVSREGSSYVHYYAFALPYSLQTSLVNVSSVANVRGMNFEQGGSLNNSEFSLYTDNLGATLNPPILINGMACTRGYIVRVTFTRTANCAVSKVSYNLEVIFSRNGPNIVVGTGTSYS